MFSKVYKALYYQRWFRQACLTSHWGNILRNTNYYSEKRANVARMYGRS